ncbi:MAG: choice-of-anchor D domain-containing protein [Terriglobales bacterium]
MLSSSLRFLIHAGAVATLAGGLLGQTIQTVAGGTPRPGRSYDASQVQLSYPVVGDGAGDFYLGGHAEVYKITAEGKLSLYAGTGVSTNSGGNGPAQSTPLNWATALAMDASGNLYIADEYASVVREVDAGTGEMTVIAGQPGLRGSSGDGGQATSALLSDPISVAVDASGAVYIGDGVECSVRKIGTDGTIQTLLSGCNQATSVQYPEGLAVDAGGNLYIADNQRDVVWRRDAGTGQVKVYAGLVSGQTSTCTTAQQNDGTCPASQTPLPGYPDSVTVDAAGDVYIGVMTSVVKVSATTGSMTSVADVKERGIWSDATGNVWVADPPKLERIDAASGKVTEVAGSDLPYLGDAAEPLDAQLGTGVGGIAVDAAGDIFVGGNPIVEITPSGQLRTVAGGGSQSPQAGPVAAAAVDLSGIRALALDGQGNLYIAVWAPTGHIYKLDMATGQVSNFAGSFTAGETNTDGALATAEELDSPQEVAVDGAGNVYLTESHYNVVWEVTKNDGVIHRIAGKGLGPSAGDGGLATQATLVYAGGLAVDGAGNVYVGDQNRVRKVDHSTGIITTIAGTGTDGETGDGGAATAATLRGSQYLAVNAAGDVFVSAFSGDEVRRVRASDGWIETIAGGGNQWDAQFAGPALDAALAEVNGLALDANGNLFFASDPQVVREVKLQSALALTPTVLTFAAQNLNTTSAAQTVTLTNSGGSALNISGITLAGADAGDFAETNTCGAALAAGAQCAVSVTFAPTASGSRTANLEISDDAAVGTAEVALDGTGVVANAQLSASALDLGEVTAGATGPAQAVTLSNSGHAALAITSVVVTGNFAESNNCGSSLAPGAQCAMQVTFSPTSTTNYNGQLTVNFAGGSQAVMLSGKGVDFGLQVQLGGSQASIAAGAGASFGLEVQSEGDLSGRLTSSCSIAPATTTIGCSTDPASGSQFSYLGLSPSLVHVNVTTQARSLLEPVPPGGPENWGWPLAAAGLLLAAGLLWRGRRWLPAVGLGAALILAGCGGGGGGSTAPPPPPPAATGTPAGTYTITVSLTVGPVTHTIPLTLVVQ